MPGRSRGNPLGRPPGRYNRQQCTTLAERCEKQHEKRQFGATAPNLRPSSTKRKARRRRQQHRQEIHAQLEYLAGFFPPADQSQQKTTQVPLCKQKSEQKSARRKRGIATSTTTGRRAMRLADEHKREFQPVNNVRMALQPAQKWRLQQDRLHQRQKELQTRITRQQVKQHRHQRSLPQKASPAQACPSEPFRTLGGLPFTTSTMEKLARTMQMWAHEKVPITNAYAQLANHATSPENSATKYSRNRFEDTLQLRRGSTVVHDKTDEQLDNGSDSSAQIANRLENYFETTRQIRHETKQLMREFRDLMDCFTEQGQQQKTCTPSRSVAFRKIGGLCFTVFAESNLATWEQRYLKEMIQHTALAGRRKPSDTVGATMQELKSENVRPQQRTTIYSNVKNAKLSDKTEAEIRRRSTRWRSNAWRRNGQVGHQRSTTGKFFALRRASTRWRRSPACNDIVRRYTRWRWGGSEDGFQRILRMDEFVARTGVETGVSERSALGLEPGMGLQNVRVLAQRELAPCDGEQVSATEE